MDHGPPLSGYRGGKLNLPNLVTSVRILLVPIFILVFYYPLVEAPLTGSLLAASVFLVASLTDLLDGWLARRRAEITRMGKLLDPVADKILVVSALILLVAKGRVPAWIAIVLIGRDFAVTGLRAIAAAEGEVIPADAAGKWKMALQIGAILLLIVNDEFANSAGLFLLLVSLAVAVLSAGRYFIRFARSL